MRPGKQRGEATTPKRGRAEKRLLRPPLPDLIPAAPAEQHLEELEDRMLQADAVHVDLIHQETFEPLIICKSFDDVIWIGLLVAKLVAACGEGSAACQIQVTVLSRRGQWVGQMGHKAWDLREVRLGGEES